MKIIKKATDNGIIGKNIADETTLLKGMASRFVAFCDRFCHYFRSHTHDSSVIAKQYLCGLMQASKKNMERMEEVVPNSDEQALQHFCSNSQWDERQVLDQVALETDNILGGHENSCLLIES